MNWFRKKKKEEQEQNFEIPTPPHEHTWKDFPWYMLTEYNGEKRIAEYSIIEPYVCITCGERKNKKLEGEHWTNISSEQREKDYAAIRKKYKRYLRPRAVVEDMINNVLLVKDPEHLDMIEKMRGTPHRGIGTSSNMPKTEFRIDLERD